MEINVSDSYLRLFLIAQDNLEKVCAENKRSLICKKGALKYRKQKNK